MYLYTISVSQIDHLCGTRVLHRCTCICYGQYFVITVTYDEYPTIVVCVWVQMFTVAKWNFLRRGVYVCECISLTIYTTFETWNVIYICTPYIACSAVILTKCLVHSLSVSSCGWEHCPGAAVYMLVWLWSCTWVAHVFEDEVGMPSLVSRPHHTWIEFNVWGWGPRVEGKQPGIHCSRSTHDLGTHNSW